VLYKKITSKIIDDLNHGWYQGKTMNLMPEPSVPLFARLQSMNERVILTLGMLAFSAAVLLSVAARWYLEVRADSANSKLVSEKVKERPLAKGDILVPVTLNIKIKEGRVTLRGMLPNEAAHQTVLARTRAIYGQNVDDNLGIQPGIVVTPWFDSVLKWFPPRVAELSAGEISISGIKVWVFGQVPTIEARLAAGRTLSKLVGVEGQFFNELQVSLAGQTSGSNVADGKSMTVKESRLAPARIQF
jgi:hypothetical protein